MSNEGNTLIEICFDEEEMDLLKSRMKEAGYTDINEYCRDKGINARIEVGDASGCDACIKELNAISEDLTKLREIAASQNSPYLNELENMQNELHEAMLKMNGIRNGNH